MENTIKNNNVTRKLKFFEAFAGIGITQLALRDLEEKLNVEVECVGYSEINAMAKKCYERLHPNVPCYDDVTTIDWSKIDVDILSWTSPCQSVSKGNQSIVRGLKEGSGTKSSIVWEIKKALKYMPHKPRTIFFENVEGILSPENKKDFDEFVDYLRSEGYFVTYKKIDASKVGFPQHRVRIYLFATLGVDLQFEYPKERPLDFYLSDILEKDVDEKYFFTPALRPHNHMLENAAIHDGHRKMRIHNPSYAKCAYCITTKAGSRNDDNFVFLDDVNEMDHLTITRPNLEKYGLSLDDLHNVGYRKLTPREVMTLMGLKEEEQVHFHDIRDSYVYEMMGNAIIRPVLSEIFEGYFKALLTTLF